MKFTFYGHSAFLIETAGFKLLFDPFITPNEQAKDIDINTIEADFILLSHGHGDHIADAITIAKRTGAKVISTAEMIAWINKQGIENAHPMNTGGKRSFDFGSVKLTVAHHSSSLPDGSYAANPVGFLITSKEGTFYYSGDTSLTLDMQLIPTWTKVDFAILPIGDNYTMGYEDAATAANFVQTKKVIGIHFDTFGWIKIDHEAAKKAFSDKGVELILPTIGETIAVSY